MDELLNLLESILDEISETNALLETLLMEQDDFCDAEDLPEGE